MDRPGAVPGWGGRQLRCRNLQLHRLVDPELAHERLRRRLGVVWTAPNCGSPPHGPTVQFKDAHLKACILNALSGNPTELLVTTAQQLPQVNCPGAGITDVTGLENF